MYSSHYHWLSGLCLIILYNAWHDFTFTISIVFIIDCAGVSNFPIQMLSWMGSGSAWDKCFVSWRVKVCWFKCQRNNYRHDLSPYQVESCLLWRSIKILFAIIKNQPYWNSLYKHCRSTRNLRRHVILKFGNVATHFSLEWSPSPVSSFLLLDLFTGFKDLLQLWGPW